MAHRCSEQNKGPNTQQRHEGSRMTTATVPKAPILPACYAISAVWLHYIMGSWPCCFPFMRKKHTVRVVAPIVVHFSCASGSCLKSSTVASLWNLTAYCHLFVIFRRWLRNNNTSVYQSCGIRYSFTTKRWSNNIWHVVKNHPRMRQYMYITWQTWHLVLTCTQLACVYLK